MLICRQTNGYDFIIIDTNAENEDDYEITYTEEQVIQLFESNSKVIGLCLNPDLQPDEGIMYSNITSSKSKYIINGNFITYALDIVSDYFEDDFAVISGLDTLFFYKYETEELFAKVPRIPYVTITTDVRENKYIFYYDFDEDESICCTIEYDITDKGIEPTDNKLHLKNGLVLDFPISLEEASNLINKLGVKSHLLLDFDSDCLELCENQLMWRYDSEENNGIYLVGKDRIYKHDYGNNDLKCVFQV